MNKSRIFVQAHFYLIVYSILITYETYKNAFVFYND